ncbi:MAG: TolC family protein [Planctomycetota bacterium]|jgi:cobalt-zinc-cadmium efflux system outer membrane protein
MEPQPEPRGALTLREALAAALRGSPELAASAWEIRAAEARALQASLPSNPELELEAGEFGGEGSRAGFDGAEFALGLSQEILVAGKLGKRTEVARLQGHLAGWDYETVRLDVLTETTRAFVALLAAQERVAFLEESVRLSEEVLRSVREQIEAGKVPRLEASRASVTLSLQRLRLYRARRELQIRRRALAAHWGATVAAFDKVVGDLYATRPLPAADRLESFLAENPASARWSVEMELRRARLELEQAGRYPDVTVTGGVLRFEESDEHAFLAAISLPLPIFDRNQGGVREALADLERAQQEQRAAVTRLNRKLNEAYLTLSNAAGEVETLEKHVLPAAQEYFDAAGEGLRQGKLGYLEVLVAQRTLFDSKEQLVDALAAYHLAVADVERLIGRSLASVGAE